MVPAYTDISHFRAPYKNGWFSGYGADEAPPAPGGDLPAGLSPDLPAVMFDRKDGLNYFKPIIKAQVLSELMRMKFIFKGGGLEMVSVEYYTPAELAAAQASPEYKATFEATNAASWVMQKVKEGKVVLAPAWILAPISPVVAPHYLIAPSARNETAIRDAAGSSYMGILDGSTGLFASLGSTGKLVAAAAIGVGVAAALGYAYKRRRRGGGMPSFG